MSIRLPILESGSLKRSIVASVSAMRKKDLKEHESAKYKMRYLGSDEEYEVVDKQTEIIYLAKDYQRYGWYAPQWEVYIKESNNR